MYLIIEYLVQNLFPSNSTRPVSNHCYFSLDEFVSLAQLEARLRSKFVEQRSLHHVHTKGILMDCSETAQVMGNNYCKGQRAAQNYEKFSFLNRMCLLVMSLQF